MGRSKHKNGQQTQNQHLINPGSSESEDDLDEVLIVSRYGEKDEKNNVWFRFSDLVTEEKHNSNLNSLPPAMYPVGFPGTHYSIAVKELVIEWKDYQDEFCGYVECLNMNENSVRTWQKGLLNRSNSNRGKQLLRFVKPPGRKTTFIQVENVTYFGLHLQRTGEKEGFYPKWQRKHEIECAIKPMFDENGVLPIKNAHLTVEIKINKIKF